ncbi:ABC-type multidrug transport system, ATPase and permease components [Anaerolinea thermolimosa]|uniref:ABC transporter ATP-binding protein n=1 Tax=Anaerolinea thermolimosa TaxID=229919 RepID=UPI00078251C0|nr:ABC transporter ATP-binding protein [Anaerolinea thermolimosa]GAP08136.1 ABC-type multidrug transport system, ATPase and permease components [Anaerolinea thermolimosa]
MSFTIGSGGMGMGPGYLLDTFGSTAEHRGKPFNPRVVRRLLAFLRPHWRTLLVAFVAMLIATGLTLLIPYLLKLAIDQYIGKNDYPGLVRIALITGLAYLGLYASSAGQQYLLSRVGQRLLSTMRADLFRHLNNLSLSYHDTHIVGVTVSRVINDVAVINDLLSQGWITFIGDAFILAGIIWIMFSMNVKLAIIALLVVPLMILATVIFARHAQAAFRETRSSVARVVGNLAEEIAGIRVIQAFAQENTIEERFREVNRANRDANINAMSLSFIYMPTIEFLSTLATALVLWFGGRSVIAGEVTLGVLVAFLSYVSRFFQPIQELSRLYTTMQSAMAGGEQVLNVLDTPPDVQDAPDAVEMPPIRGRIEFRNVSFRYRPDAPEVLHNINLTIEPGTRAALVGPTGAGKSTIANLAARFYEVTNGAVLIDGIDVRTVKQGSLRRQVGVVPQDSFLFAGTIAENIRFGRPEASDAEVEEAARMANAHDFIISLPDGYQTPILENAANLSVGQRQLICIARAILVNPRILILDEATANIDTVSEALIQQALERLLQGRTAIIIAHRLSTIQNADIIYVIQDGRIVEQGRHEELLALGGVYRTLHGKQFKGEQV